MSGIKVYSPTIIAEAAFPSEDSALVTQNVDSANTGQVYSAKETPEQSFPTPKIATELLSTAINTRSKKILQSFEFTQSGAIQIGRYENGVSGDLKISPSGIVGRNASGVTTFALDADTGDAYFMGTIQANTVIGGAVAVGDGSILIDGATKRIVFYDQDGIPVIIIGNA